MKRVKAFGIAGMRGLQDHICVRVGKKYMTMRDMYRCYEAVSQGGGVTPSVAAQDAAPAPPEVEPCDVAPTARIKPGERDVVEAMQKEATPISMPDDPEVAWLKGEVNQMKLQLAELRALFKEHLMRHGKEKQA